MVRARLAHAGTDRDGESDRVTEYQKGNEKRKKKGRRGKRTKMCDGECSTVADGFLTMPRNLWGGEEGGRSTGDILTVQEKSE